jgi:hypothetical protein
MHSLAFYIIMGQIADEYAIYVRTSQPYNRFSISNNVS